MTQHCIELRDSDGVLHTIDEAGRGLNSINVETLSGDTTLTPGTDEIYQYLDEGGANRIITLDTASAAAGDRFTVRHNGDYDDNHSLEVKQAAVSLDKIWAGAIKEFIFDGTDWVGRGIGTGEGDFKKYNLAIGALSKVYRDGLAPGGVAVGYDSDGTGAGVAVGVGAKTNNLGVGIGAYAQCYNQSVCIGSYTKSNSKARSIALGRYSECERDGETSINIDATTDQENNVIQGRWAGETVNDTPLEIFCAGFANQRFTIRAKSHLAFKVTVVARDNVANEGAMYTFEGLIKRDASNNTTLSVANKVVVHEDDAGWDCNVTADDTNEALIITVTGDGANTTQWAAVMNGVETHF